MEIRAAELARIVGGILLGGDPNALISRLSTDSRTVNQGEFFWALDGKNFRGAEFVAPALSRRASGAIASELPADAPQGTILIRVADTTRALGDLANWWRKSLATPMLALSGSAGKTTTKEMSAHILRGSRKTLSSEGNRNNVFGLPLTMLDLNWQHEAAVVELGMNHPGELTRLTEIADPDFVVVTNIGNAHVGNFGSEDELMRGEAEVLAAMRHDAIALVNVDNPRCVRVLREFATPRRVLTYGIETPAEFTASNIARRDPMGYSFTLEYAGEKRDIRIGLFGRYQVYNALAAAAATYAMGIGFEEIADRLATFEPPSLRAQVEYVDGVALIADCYNASPDPMIASLRSARDFSVPGRRIALLGQMLELGDMSEQYHRAIAPAIQEGGFDFVACVGDATKHTIDELRKFGISGEYFPGGDDAAAHLSRELRSGDLLFVKGSRGNRLENAICRLKELRQETRNASHPVSQKIEA